MFGSCPSHRICARLTGILATPLLLTGLNPAIVAMAAPGTESSRATPGGLEGDRPAALNRGSASSVSTLPGAPSFAFPGSYLSGASLLFVIWLVADRVSADLYGASQTEHSGQSQGATGAGGVSPEL